MSSYNIVHLNIRKFLFLLTDLTVRKTLQPYAQKLYNLQITGMFESLKKFVVRPNNEDYENIIVDDGKTITLKEDPLIDLKAIVDDKVLELRTTGTTITTVNGYGLSPDTTKLLKPGDCLCIEGIHYKVELEPMKATKRKSDQVDDSAVQKKVKLAPLFNMKNARRKSSDVSGTWECINGDLLIFTPVNLEPKSKIASFDLDGTLIRTKSGKVFPTNDDDWIINTSNITDCLKQLLDEDYKLVIFTNQNGLGKNPDKIPGWKKKVEKILSTLGVPLQVFGSTKRGINRKPCLGMYHVLVKEKNMGVDIDLAQSFFVGDAAGRAKGWGGNKKKDHSTADRLFALNLNIPFYTPEEYFLKQPQAKYELPKLNPATLKSGKINFEVGQDLEVIVMVGSPGSGKSLFCSSFLDSYVRVNRDTLGTWQNCVKQLETALKDNRSVVVDNTNKDRGSRQRYIECAKKHNVKCRCFVMDIDRDLAKHNNRFREMVDPSHAVISDIIINSHFKNYEEPNLDEGFSEIIKIPFIAQFNDPSQERLYKSYLLET